MKVNQTRQAKFDFSKGGLKTNVAEILSHRIHGRNKLDKFIPNGRKLRSVGYDYNIEYILDMLNKNDWDDVTIIVGYRLSGKDCDESILAEVMKEIKKGRLKIRIPSKGEFHEKFFLVEGEQKGEGVFIDINGSAYPTMTGSARRGRQSNRITEITISGNF